MTTVTTSTTEFVMIENWENDSSRVLEYEEHCYIDSTNFLNLRETDSEILEEYTWYLIPRSYHYIVRCPTHSDIYLFLRCRTKIWAARRLVV